MRETDYRLSDAFQVHKDKKIAIYGIGAETEAFLKCFEGKLSITGVLDEYHDKGMIYGENIISLEEMSARGTQIIIIIARAASQKVIFNRISEFCKMHEIKVIDKNGNDLEEKYKDKDNGVINKEHMSCFDFGYQIYAPIISKFIIWLAKELVESNYEAILFLARDGYLIKKMFGVLKNTYHHINLPESVYFLTSRSICAISVADMHDYLLYFAKFAFSGSPEQMLEKRFFLKPKSIIQSSSDISGSIEGYVLMHKEQIAEQANVHRSRYLDYIWRVCPMVFNRDRKIAIFDLISSGTCHMCLQEITSREFDGYYYNYIEEDCSMKKQLNVKAMYQGNNDDINEYDYLIELLTKSVQPSLLCFSDIIEPIFQEEIKSMDFREAILEAQDGAIQYFNDNVIRLFEMDINTLDPRMIKKLRDVDCTLFQNDIYMDEFTRRPYNVESLL